MKRLLRERIKESIQDIIPFLDSANPCMIGQTIWALGELGVSEEVERIRGFINDKRETWFYKNDSVEKASIGEIAREAISKMERPV